MIESTINLAASKSRQGKFLSAPWKTATSVLMLSYSLLFSHFSFAADPADFDIEFRENRGAVTVIEFSGNLNKDDEGELNSLPRQLIAQEFYKNHADSYDFLVVFSTFEYETGEASAFHTLVKNDVQGIGLPIADNSALYGSNGRLKGVIDMAAISRRVTDPLLAGFDDTLMMLGHEMLHQWSGRVSFNSGAGNDRSLIGKDDAHWSNLFDSGASLLYGHQWRDNGDGTYSSTAQQKFFSPLDLYLAGFNKAEEVPAMKLIDNAAIDKNLTPAQSLANYGSKINGTRRTVTLEHIIAAEGPRVPAFSEAQKDFKIAFILLTEPNKSVAEANITALNNISRGFIDRFSIWTGGRATASVSAEAKPTEAGSPGEVIGGDVRSDPAVLSDGFNWLREQQTEEGFWRDKETSTVRDTTVALDVLRRLDSEFTRRNSALDWLQSQPAKNVDYQARQAKVAYDLGRQTYAKGLIAELLKKQNTDGGWGLEQGYRSNPFDTSLALTAIANGDNQANIDKAVAYLKQSQNADGGWSSRELAESNTYVTTVVLNILNKLNQQESIAESAIDWLASKQNADGGFGESPSTLHATASVIKTFIHFSAGEKINFGNAADYLLTNQQPNGSWANSRYVTAVTLDALQQFSYPNLMINPVVAVSPTEVTDGDRVQLSVTVSNNSNVEATPSILRLYDGDPANGGTAVGQDVEIPLLASGMSVELILYWDSMDKPGDHQLFLLADPDENLVEMSELDNVASVAISVANAPDGIDVAISPADVLVTPKNPDLIPSDIGFAVTLRNQGTQTADNLVVQLRKDSVGGEILDQQIVNLPGRSSIATSLTHGLQTPGMTRFYILLDPQNNLSETNENNNTTSVDIITRNSLDLRVTAADISINSDNILVGSDVNFNVNLSNLGTNNSPSFNVRYQISDGVTTKDIQSNQVQIAAGSSVQQSIVWRVDLTGQLTLSVFIDEFNQVPEVNELNNNATHIFSAGTAQGPNLTLSYQDMTFEPAIALQGSPNTLSVLVRNNGNADANNVEVSFYDGDPATGGQLIGKTSPSVQVAQGNSQRVSFVWDSPSTAGDKVIYAVVDPENSIGEFLESDNSAFKVMEVLSLPDLAISPADILIVPAFPKEGDEINLDITVFNLGQQSAQLVNLSVFDSDPALGGQLLGSGQISELAANNNESVSVNIGNLFPQGKTSLFIVVDPDNSVIESDQNNNSASKELIIQNGDFYITQRFISPNGDDIQDSTDFFFRLQSLAKVTITIINSRQEEVRQFSGGELDDIDFGSIRWDGLDRLGRVLPDGDYEIQLKANNILMGSSLVEIDNNRSSLLTAIGTPNSVMTNLTCEVSDYNNFQYTADESKIIFTINESNLNDLYSPGLYQMSANGTGIKLILPQSFFDSNDIEIPADKKLFITDDGKTVVFSDRRSITYNQYVLTLWKVDVNTSAATLVRSEERNSYGSPTNYGLTSDNLSVIENELGQLSTVSLVNGERTSLINLLDQLGLYDSLYNEQVQFSADRNKLIFSGVSYDTFVRYLLLIDITNGSLTLLNESPFQDEGEEPDQLTTTWRKDGKGFSIFDPSLNKVDIYNDQGTILSSYPLPTLNANVVERTITAVDWSPLNDEVAFSYFAGMLYPFPEDGNHYPNLDNLGGVFKLNIASGEFSSVYEYTIGDSNCRVEEGVCDPRFVGPAPIGVELVWNEAETIVYRSLRFPYSEENNNDYVNETWALHVNGSLPPMQIFAEFSQDSWGYSSLRALEKLRFSPQGSRLLFRSDFSTETQSACKFAQKNEWSYRSLLNLTADLRALRSANGGGINLSGTATDKNFKDYVLEYASAESPNVWSLVQPANNRAVIDDQLALWVPPTTGTFYIRLSVSDLAGNTKRNVKRVAWSEETAIGNLYRDESYISPNGDGIQDFAAIYYLVLQPVHLDFKFFDENGVLVRTISRDHSALGEQFSVSWDGRDDAGNILPDGQYRMRLLDYEFEFTTDNTPPVANIELFDAYHAHVPRDPKAIPMGTPYLSFSVSDANPDTGVVNQINQASQSVSPYQEIDHKKFDGRSIVLFKDSTQYFTGAFFEVIAADRAGNKTIVTTPMTSEEIILVRYGTHQSKILNGNSVVKPIDDVDYTVKNSNETGNLINVDFDKPARIEIPETIIGRSQQLSVEYRELAESAWQSEILTEFTADDKLPENFVGLDAVDHNFFAYWHHSRVDIGKEYVIRLAAIDTSGTTHYSNVTRTRFNDRESIALAGWRRDMRQDDPIAIIDELIRQHPEPISAEDFIVWGTNGVSKPVSTIDLYIKSSEDPRYAIEQFKGRFENPADNFIFPINDLKGCTSYILRTEAIAEDGELYASAITLSTPCLELYVRSIPDYNTSCNLPANQVSTIEFATVTANNIELKLLTLAPANDTSNILFNINKPSPSPVNQGVVQYTHSFSLDTSQFEEGTINYLARLVNVEDEEVLVPFSLVVDRTPPSLSINTPIQNGRVCKSNLFIDGSISDNNAFRYLLEYSSGTSFDEATSKVFYFKNVETEEDLRKLKPTVRESIYNLIPTSIAENGELGTFIFDENVTGDVSVRLSALDLAGHRQCSVREFNIDGEVGLNSTLVQPNIASPNADGINDELTVFYHFNEAVELTLQVYSYTPAPLDAPAGVEFILQDLQVTLLEQQAVLAGENSVTWNGTGTSGDVLPDGDYVLVYTAVDACGNTRQIFEFIFIDTEPPSIDVTYPNATDPLGMIIEIQGAIDESSSLEFGEQLKNSRVDFGTGSIPANWISLYEGEDNALEHSILWNTFGLVGLHTLRVVAEDRAGNINSILIPVTVDNQVSLITYLEGVENLFSPNDDGIRDETSIRFGLAQDSTVDLFVEDADGNLLRTLIDTVEYSSGGHLLNWNGLDLNGNRLSDGVYQVKIVAALTENLAVKQQEEILLTLDATFPTIEILRPKNDFTSAESGIVGTISDSNLTQFELSLATNPLAPVWQIIASGTENKMDTRLASLENYAEGDYALKITAKDAAGSINEQQINFTIDNTYPQVTLTQPQNNAFLSGIESSVVLGGLAVEKNPDVYEFRYAKANTPNEMTTVLTGSQFPLPGELGNWNVAALSDGAYLLEFSVQDKAGLKGKTTHQVVVDNSAPLAEISSPAAQAYVTKPIEIVGTANDINLAEYKIYVAPLSDGELRYTQINAKSTSVTNGALGHWLALPVDGEYSLKLEVIDKANNSSESTIVITVDTKPPVKPTGLNANLENGRNIRLTWMANSEADIAGYIVLRAGVEISGLIENASDYLVQNAEDGLYEYSVLAVDRAGLKSEPSEPVIQAIDVTPPNAALLSPVSGERVSSLMSIIGTASSPDDFKEYRVYVKPDSAERQLIRRSGVPVQADVLVDWNTIGLSESGNWTVSLEAEDLSGNIATAETIVSVDNTPPGRPVGLGLTVSDNDVSLLWDANSENDLLGYLIYRNDKLANANGPVIGELGPFAITANSYADLELADGSYAYAIVAIDTAGNLSDPSAIEETTIDRRAPKASITNPRNGLVFEQALTVRAESEDSDIASVLFQYQQGDSAWQDFGIADSGVPFEVSLDPAFLALDFGIYQLRAIATDNGGQFDATPTDIEVYYSDLTEPKAVEGLLARVQGEDINLSWLANDEIDLSHYAIYLASGEDNSFELIANVDVGEASYTIASLPENDYTIHVLALDQSENASEPSVDVSARVYTPEIKHPYTPTRATITQLAGQALSVATVSGEIANSQSTTSIVPFDTDLEGVFSLPPIALIEGQNTITIRLTDTDGNTSKDFTTVVVQGQNPSEPTGLAAEVTDLNVSLDWIDNPETNLLGYRIYDNEESVLVNRVVSGNSYTASSDDQQYSYGSYAIGDGLNYTSWSPQVDYEVEDSINGEWVQVTLGSMRLVTSVEIDWLALDRRALDFDLQAWTGSGWVSVAEIRNNQQTTNLIELNDLYYTSSLRVLLRKATLDAKRFSPVSLAEVRIMELPLQSSSDYLAEVADGIHAYRVSAINQLGFESDLSDPVDASVGDVTPPEAVVLSAESNIQDVTLTWTASNSVDLARYEIYRNDQSVAIFSDISVVSYNDIDLANGSYRYLVKAIDAVGNHSDSNEVTVAVSSALPDSPTDLTLNAPEAGKTLELSWSHPQPQAVSQYQILRSVRSGGGFELVAHTDTMSFTDLNLTNGIEYFYVVLALDSLNNASDYSSEVMGVPQDSLAPITPVIYYPTTAGQTYTSTKPVVTITGLAEAGSQVQLLRNGNQIGQINAVDESTTQDIALDIDSDFIQFLADGSGFIFEGETGNSTIHRYDIGTNTQSRLVSTDNYNPVYPKISHDGKQITYIDLDTTYYNTYARVYDIETGSNIALTDPQQANVSAASISPDSRYLAIFGYVFDNAQSGGGLWLYDLVEKQWLENFHGGSGFERESLQWSPDGKYISFTSNDGLIIYDLQTKSLTYINSDVRYQATHWSINSSQLLYSFFNESTGQFNLTVFDLDLQSELTLLTSEQNLRDPLWSPDGSDIYYVQAYNDLRRFNIESASSDLIFSSFEGFYDPQIASNGQLLASITYESHSSLARITPQGHFSFVNVRLSQGDNTLLVNAIDDAGNSSDNSGAILLNYEIKNRVDLALDLQSFGVSPQVPTTGENVQISVQVYNYGDVLANQSQLSVVATTADGTHHQLLDLATVPQIPVNGRETLSFNWNLGGIEGPVQITAVIDPRNEFLELDEANNSISTMLMVAGEGGIASSLTVDKTNYLPGESVTVMATISNGGNLFSGQVELIVEDMNGYLVESILVQAVEDFDYAENLDFTIDWSTGAVFSGAYRVKLNVYDETNQLVTSNTQNFTIQSNSELATQISTNESTYPGNSDVTVAGVVNYSNGNELLSNLTAKIEVRDSLQAILSERTFVIAELVPDSSSSVELMWNTGDLPIATYSAHILLYQDDVLISEASTQFSIVSSGLLVSGELDLVNGLDVGKGELIVVDYQVTNESNVVISQLKYFVNLVSGDGTTLLQSETGQLDIDVGQTITGNVIFESNELDLNDYKIRFEYEIIEADSTVSMRLIDTKTIGVRDFQAPEINLILPAEGAIVNGLNSAAQITATDLYSEIRRVEVLFDNGNWQVVEQDQQRVGWYYQNLENLSEGAHTVRARAFDMHDNSSETPITNFVIDNRAPNIVVTQVVSDGVYVSAVTPVINVTDANLFDVVVKLNDQPFTPGSSVVDDGIYLLTVTATDFSGNYRYLEISFTIDSMSPIIDISGVSEGQISNQNIVPVISITDANLTQQSITLNGAPFVSGTAITSEGDYTLSVNAEDIAANQTSQSLSFTIDKTAASVTVTGVSDGDFVSSDVTPVITFSEPGLLNQVITLNNQPFDSNSLISAEGIYVLHISANDPAGNTTVANLTFTIDKTAPTIVIDGVSEGLSTMQDVTPVVTVNDTNLLSQTLTLNGADFVSGTLISADGSYQIVATALDAAGNQTVTTINFEIDRVAPQISISGINDGQHSNQDVLLAISISDAHLNDQSILLNGVDYISSTPIADEGEYLIDVSAADNAGNQTSLSLSFVIDKTAPVIQINGVSDGLITNQSVTPVISISDSYLSQQTLELNGLEYISETSISEIGEYSLLVTAQDQAGNDNQTLITFEIIEENIAIIISSPLSGSTVSSEIIDIFGSTSINANISLIKQDLSRLDVVADSEGNFVLTQVALIEGENQFVLQATSTSGIISDPVTLIVNRITSTSDYPVISMVSGSGPYPVGTRTIELIFATDKEAFCKISENDQGEFKYWPNTVTSDDSFTHSSIRTLHGDRFHKFYVRCQSLDNLEVTPVSFEFPVYFGDPGVLSQPLNLVADEPLNLSGEFTLTWDEIVGTNEYHLVEQKDGGLWVPIELSPEQRAVTLSRTENGRYVYFVSACIDVSLGQCSSFSDEAIVSVGADITHFPPVISAVLGSGPYPDGTREIDFTVATNLAAECRYSGSDKGKYNYWEHDFTSQDDRIHDNNAKLYGDHYTQLYVRCRAKETGYYNKKSFVFPVYFGNAETLTKPTQLQADNPNNMDGEFTLSWQGVDGVVGYHLMEKFENENWNPVEFDDQQTSIALSRPTLGLYRYHVSACANSEKSDCSEFSDVTHVSVGSDPYHFPPVISYVSGSGPYPYGTKTVSISVSTNIEAECRHSGSDSGEYQYWSHGFSTTDNLVHQTTFPIGGKSDQLKYIRCRAVDSGFTNNTSFEFSIFVTEPGELEKPREFVADNPVNTGDFILSWLPVENAHSYRYKQRFNGSSWQSAYLEKEVNSLIFQNKSPGKYDFILAGCSGIEGKYCGEKSDMLTVTVLDGSGNQPPEIISTPEEFAKVGVEYVYQILAVDPDPDEILTYSFQSCPQGVSLDPVSGVLTWTPGASQVGMRTLNVIVTDSGGLKDTQTISILVGE